MKRIKLLQPPFETWARLIDHKFIYLKTDETSLIQAERLGDKATKMKDTAMSDKKLMISQSNVRLRYEKYQRLKGMFDDWHWCVRQLQLLINYVSHISHAL